MQNINLDFLYYQRVAVLDGVDLKEEEYEKVARAFKNKMKETTLNDVVKLIILGYKERYAQQKFYATCFYDVSTGLNRPEEPDYVGENDFYLDKYNMVRKDIEYLFLKIFKDDYEKTNARFLTEMELVFSENQKLENTVDEALEGKILLKEKKDDETIFIVDDSPISKIKITNRKFTMITNPEKWKAYY